MKTRLQTILQKLRVPVLVCIAGGLVIGTAVSQTPVVQRDTINTNPGPFAVVEQGANVMLALSVEFPTVGTAYRTSTFEPEKNYLGYWDHTGCYKYGDNGTASALRGHYYYRTGTWNAARECNHNGASGEYSGNLLNYVASSAIDILRLGLTGGHRELDTDNLTVLSRAYLYKNWGLYNDHYAPKHQIPKSSLGKHLPAAPDGITVNNYVYTAICRDKLWFGSNMSWTDNCASPSEYSQNLTPSGDYEAELAVRSHPSEIRTTDGCSVCSRGRMIAGFEKKGHTITFKDVRVPAAGYYDLYMRYGHNRIANPRIRYKVGNEAEGTATLSNTGMWEPRQRGVIRNVYFPATQQDVMLMTYGANDTEANNNAFYIDLLYQPVQKDATPPDYYGGISPAFARVKVCDASENTTRTDLCQRYPNGNYKPIGEIQKNAQNARIGAFGYLDISGYGAKYGGVMRAPLSYIGPSVTDANGIDVANPNAEWDSNTGVFVADPRTGYITAGVKDGATGGFPYSGAINYLNRFGTLNPGNLGYYKGNDPLGEMYYENIRYFMGKQPAGAAIASVNSVSTDTVAGGFPFYKNWQDPITNQCQKKNFILTIGDVYTWEYYDLGTENSINPSALSNDLAGYEGFSGNRRIQWAGAAWAANTRKIRNDFEKVRVKTFAIDVDEGGDGKIDGNKRPNPKPRQSSMYLAGKYGWFAGANLRPNAGEWDSKETNVPDGYVLASQAEKLLQGIKDFFAAVPKETASIQSSAISSQLFSSVTSENAIFIPSMNPANWSGSLEKRKLTYSTSTGSISMNTTPSWNAASILTSGTFADGSAALAWNERKVFTWSRDPAKLGGQVFSVASKGNLDTDVVTSLNTRPSDNTTDNKADERINFILGDRSNEQSGGSGMFRKRASLMGDIVFSGPAYKQAPDAIFGKGYAAFMAQADIKNRRPAVYVGANDGMLHAFDGENGKELFAYIPRAVAENLNRLTNPNYAHTQFVDGVPAVGEAQIHTDHGSASSASNWKTVLVSGMGGGAQGLFALDVTKPESFGASNVMFEFTDRDDPDMGNIMGKPRIVKMQRALVVGGTTKYVTRWYVAVGSGYNNYAPDGHASTTGVQSLFLLSLDKKPGDPWVLGTLGSPDDATHNYYKISVQPPDAPSASSKEAVGMANPGVAEDVFGNVTAFYAGDLAGQLWKFNFENGINSVNAGTAVKTGSGKKLPLAIFKDATGKLQPVTSPPLVALGLRKGYMVMAGTGKFMEAADAGSTHGTQQAIYGIWDDGSSTPSNYQVTRNKLQERNFDASGKTDSTAFTLGNASGQKRGWVINLKESRERISIEGALEMGYATFNSVLPSDDECSGGGTGTSMTIDPLQGTSTRLLHESFPGTPFFAYLDDSSGSYSFGVRSSTGKRIFKIKVKPMMIGSNKNLAEGANKDSYVAAGRVGWREIRQFLD